MILIFIMVALIDHVFEMTVDVVCYFNIIDFITHKASNFVVII